MRRAALLAASLVALFSSPARSLTPLGSEFRANTYTTGAQRNSSVASDSAGDFVVVWESLNQDGSGRGVFGRRFSSSGAPLGTEFRVNSYAAGDQSYPSAVSDSGGAFVVVWQRLDGVFGRRFSSSGVALGTDFQVNSYATGTQILPDVAADAGGDFVVIWESEDQYGGGHGVFGRLFSSAGAATGVEFQVSSFTTNYQIFPPSVAAGADGDFVVVWTSFGQDGSSSGVFGQRFANSGEGTGTEFQENSFTTGYQSRPSVSSDADGNFVVAWTSYGQDGAYAGVFGQRFASSGAAAGTEFQVNSVAFDAQNHASVASDAAGNFVVVWNSVGQDGSDYGVFGRRFFDDLIFQDGFESGDFSSWSSAATDGGDLSVSATAALASSLFGLEALVDDTAGIHVRDDSPDGESRYRARFYFDPNGFDPGEASGHLRARLLLAFDDSSQRVITIVLRRINGDYGVRGRVRLDDGTRADTPFIDIADAPHAIELDWKRSSGPSANDGRFELFLDGTSRATLANLDNNASTIEFTRLGPASVKSGASGTLFFDEFVSRRAKLIGLVP